MIIFILIIAAIRLYMDRPRTVKTEPPVVDTTASAVIVKQVGIPPGKPQLTTGSSNTFIGRSPQTITAGSSDVVSGDSVKPVMEGRVR